MGFKKKESNWTPFFNFVLLKASFVLILVEIRAVVKFAELFLKKKTDFPFKISNYIFFASRVT